MDWLNENSGVIVLVTSIIIIVLAALTVWLLVRLHSKIAVQRLKFLGFYSIDKDTKIRYAGCTIGNKSLNDVGIDELGVQNGKVNFPLTEKYKKDNGMRADSRIVVEQRSSISFNLSCDELRALLIENNGKRTLKTLRLYAVDLTGTLYRGRIPAVRKLLGEMLAAEKKGLQFSPVAETEAIKTPAAAPATDNKPAEEEVAATSDNSDTPAAPEEQTEND